MIFGPAFPVSLCARGLISLIAESLHSYYARYTSSCSFQYATPSAFQRHSGLAAEMTCIPLLCLLSPAINYRLHTQL